MKLPYANRSTGARISILIPTYHYADVAYIAKKIGVNAACGSTDGSETSIVLESVGDEQKLSIAIVDELCIDIEEKNSRWNTEWQEFSKFVQASRPGVLGIKVESSNPPIIDAEYTVERSEGPQRVACS